MKLDLILPFSIVRNVKPNEVVGSTKNNKIAIKYGNSTSSIGRCDFDGKMDNIPDALKHLSWSNTAYWIYLSWDDDTINAWTGKFKKIGGLPYGLVYLEAENKKQLKEEVLDNINV